MPGVPVLVFATDRTRWYLLSRYARNVTADADGTVTIEGLPFGTYYVAALARLPADGNDSWRDPIVLESLIPRASTVTVRDSEKTTVALQMPSEIRR
jgi:hypothetical protein